MEWDILKPELREGRYQRPLKMAWVEFREKYDTEILSALADSTAHKANDVLDVVERILSPYRVRDITAARLSYLQNELQELKGRERKPCAPATVDRYLRTLRAALSVAVDWRCMAAVPKVRKEKRVAATSRMKGRPITTEEFERMLSRVYDVVGGGVAEAWKKYLTGLWLSGLRLGESLQLYWDRNDCSAQDCLEVDLSGKRPMLRIPAVLDKGKQDRLLPVTPDFAAFLAETPPERRQGCVFTPEPTRAHEGYERRQQRISKTIDRIGKKADVVVNDQTGKCASAHDLRRAFGQRWAAKVMPHILMQLMRHAEIATTVNYYAGRGAVAAADVIWNTEKVDLGKHFR